MYASAIRAQGSVLLALMLHEASTRYGGKRLGYLWAIGEPISFIMLISFVHNAVGAQVPLGYSMFVFTSTGLLPFFVFRNTLYRVAASLRSNDALLTYPVVKSTDVVLGRAFLEAATVVMITVGVFSCLEFFGFEATPHRLLVCFASLLLLFVMALGAGLILALTITFFSSAKQIAPFILRIMYWVSGIFFLPSTLPPVALEYFWWNPVMHCIELFRVGFYAGYEGYVLNVWYMVFWALGLLITAFVAERILRRLVSAQ